MERMLKGNSEKAAACREQINEMIEQGAAIILLEEELAAWEGAYHYLPMVLVEGKKRFRVCFDGARSQCGYPSFNKHLYKGPDHFLNNLFGVLLGFCNGCVGGVADLKKFHNQIYLVNEDIHMQRFIWRDMNTEIALQFVSTTSALSQ